MEILNKIPNWIITVLISMLASYVTIVNAVNEVKYDINYTKSRIEKVESLKVDKIIFDEYTKRLDRFEIKLDKVLEVKDNK